MSANVWDIVQAAVIPLLLVIWRLLDRQLRDLKETNDKQWRRIDELGASRIGREECRDRHKPIEQALTNGLTENVHRLRERVAVLESLLKQKEGE